MRFIVGASNGYAQEVDADSPEDAVIKAFQTRLPYSLGEVVSITKPAGNSEKGQVRYWWTENLLDKIGASELYTKGKKRGFVLNKDSPEIEPIEIPLENPTP